VNGYAATDEDCRRSTDRIMLVVIERMRQIVNQ
jgi:hypothetical protein